MEFSYQKVGDKLKRLGYQDRAFGFCAHEFRKPTNHKQHFILHASGLYKLVDPKNIEKEIAGK